MEIAREDAVLHLVRGWAESSGPFTAGEMAGLLGLPLSDVNTAVAGLENEGLVLRGSFRSGVDEEEFCDRRILARIHRGHRGPGCGGRSSRFRNRLSCASCSGGSTRPTAGKPPARAACWTPSTRSRGSETAAAAWESELLPRRVSDYDPDLLDRLCTGGEVGLGTGCHGETALRPSAGSGPRSAPLTRASGITLCLRESLDWLLDTATESGDGLKGAGAEILAVLSDRGACFQSDLIAHTQTPAVRRGRSPVDAGGQRAGDLRQRYPPARPH